MPARKKRPTREAARPVSTTEKLDEGWESFIAGALKTKKGGAMWPDPSGGSERRVTSGKTAKRAKKK